MLDQSFSAENFRKIFDIQNRKGVFIEERKFFSTEDIFQKSRKTGENITKINKQNRDLYKRLKSENSSDKRLVINDKIDTLKNDKKKLKVERDIQITESLKEISERASAEKYLLKIVEGKKRHGKQTYLIENKPEHYFASKQIQWNIFKAFNVKQADRKLITNQLKLLLNDGFPKIIVRTDIEKFYESIPHQKLLAIIQENNLLSYSSKRNIKSMLNEYWKILISKGEKINTDERVGLPRGIGISAYLAELYIRSFDKEVASLSFVTYYSRYVDDIIVIFTPEHKEDKVKEDEYIEKLQKIIQGDKLKLSLNIDKTKFLDLTNIRLAVKKDLTYLGYKFILEWESRGKNYSLKIVMSDAKRERYELKLDTAFDNYSNDKVMYANKLNRTNRLLLQRIKFLTKNHRLVSSKDNIMIGVFFLNEFLTKDKADLKELDEILQDKITSIEAGDNTDLIEKLRNLSFERGFEEKEFTKFNIKSFQSGKMLNIWKNIQL